ncbi:MAG: hypothetical protein ABI382_10865 [Nakamurella sp.]
MDKLVSWLGLALALVRVVSGGLLTWGSTFIASEVHDQLAAQQIFFPSADSPAVAGAEFAGMRTFGGQQMTTGEQAGVYANDFIANYLKGICGGKTYAELSTASNADPSNTKLADQVQTVFRGETLRGLLLNPYAFGTMGTIAGIAAIGTFVAAAVMLLLAFLGLGHARGDDVVPPRTRATTRVGR